MKWVWIFLIVIMCFALAVLVGALSAWSGGDFWPVFIVALGLFTFMFALGLILD